MDTDQEKQMIKKCQEWRDSLGIKVGIPHTEFEKMKDSYFNNTDISLKNCRLIGLIDPDYSNLYEGCYIESKKYNHCLFRVYQFHEWRYFKNEMKAYAKIEKNPNNTFIYQKKIFNIYSEESQSMIIALEYLPLTKFIDFQLSLQILPKDTKVKIIFKIAKSLLKTLNYLHNTLKLVHRHISPTTVIFNLDSFPIITDFSHVHKRVAQKRSKVGFEPYLSPEIRNEKGEKTFDLASDDLYALGCLIHDLYYNEKVNSEKKSKPLLFNGNTPFEENIQAIINTLLNPDPETRIEIYQKDLWI